MKFYKRDPNAALAGMAELTLKQRGAYNSLLDALYAADGDLPDDDLRIARMISCHWREWATVKRELIEVGKVWTEGGKIYAKRVQETVKEASEFSQKQSKRASEGWQKRKKDNEINDEPMPPGNANTPTAIATATEDSSLHSAGAREWAKLEGQLRQAAGWAQEPSPNLFVVGPIAELVKSGADLDLDVLPVVRALAPKVTGKPNWKYFVGPIRDAMRARTEATKHQPQRKHFNGTSSSNRPTLEDSIDTAIRFRRQRDAEKGG